MKQFTAEMPSVAPSGITELETALTRSWKRLAPSWPLANLIAVNPLQGLETLPFEDALLQAEALFASPALPDPMLKVNRESIKWFQVFFDEGQALLPLPERSRGLYACWRSLAPWDASLQRYASETGLQEWPQTPQAAVTQALQTLAIPKDEWERFFTLLLTTLPGWASYLKYRVEWAPATASFGGPATFLDFLAVRLSLTCLMWPEAVALLKWHRQPESSEHPALERMRRQESAYQETLLQQLRSAPLVPEEPPTAQLAFCIDVRSEPFRRALESCGAYQTFGVAGFFGVPVQFQQSLSGERTPSCPVLLKPQQEVPLQPQGSPAQQQEVQRGQQQLRTLKELYQSLKQAFTTPFALAEAFGGWMGGWMALKTWAPSLAQAFQRGWTHAVRPPLPVEPDLTGLSLEVRQAYAEQALRAMGLTEGFAPLVVFCGHRSTSVNNPQATSLDCGACGGRPGGGNAQLLAAILNQPEVRSALQEQGLCIPDSTWFLGAEHNTTTDEITVLPPLVPEAWAEPLATLQKDLKQAGRLNRQGRAVQLGTDPSELDQVRAVDWSEVCPEWGLARNAAFLVAPRALSQNLNLQGRAFLHSYDWQQDDTGAWLEGILTAPMVVAQWINTQYLFSTLHNGLYGSGSKVTQNVTGKLGLMQGNASDLMQGLARQSVFVDDVHPYHEPQRLLTVVEAPRGFIDRILEQHTLLQKLFANGWVRLVCLDPVEEQSYELTRQLHWHPLPS